MAKGAGPAVTPKPGRGGAGGRGMRGGTVGFTGMSPGQFAKYVNAQTNSEFGPEFHALRAYQGGLNNMFNSEEGETNLGSEELAKMFSGIGPQVQQNYENAANADTAFSKGFGDSLGGVAPGVDQNTGNILGTEFGLVPGQSLEQQGAAMTSAADMLPQTAEGLRNAAVSGIAGEQAKSNLSMEEKMATLLGEEGRARVQIANNLQSQADRQYELNLSGQRFQLQSKMDQIRTQQSQQRINLAIKQAAFSDKVRLAELRLSGKRFQLQAAKASFSLAHGGLSQADVTKDTIKAQSMANTAFNGTTVYRTQTTTVNGQKVTREVPVTEGGIPYNQALGEIMKEGIPVQIALTTLNQAYPQNMRPSDKALQHLLGPLTPNNIQSALEKASFGATSNKFRNLFQGAADPFFTGKSGIEGLNLADPLGQRIDSLAHEYLGTRYQWGGTSPKTGFDCSGFAQFLYAKVGINIPRTSYEQWTAGNPVHGQLAPGDLVFFKGSDSKDGLPGHVGIYIGNGEMIDEPHTGSHARIESVANFGGFMGARRFGGVGVNSDVRGQQGSLERAAYQMAGKYGWGRDQMQALYQLWNRESGWRPSARNPSSGALGIPQALGHKLPPGYENNPLVQIRWGLNYIRQRYGSPAAAWEHERAFGWY